MTFISRISIEELPAFPGFAIGGLFRKADVLVEKLNGLKIREEAASKRYNDLKAAKDQNMHGPFFELKSIKEEIEIIQAKLKEFPKEQDDLGSYVEETLPISFKSEIEESGFCSEKLSHVIIKRKENAKSDIDSLISTLFPNTDLYSPPKQVLGVRDNIERLVEDNEQLTVLGSFCTLGRVKVMKDIVIKPSSVNKKMKENADQYGVLTEAILGAVFIGIGRHISRKEENLEGKETLDQQKTSKQTRNTMVSFISQGAIPQISRDPEDVNLWNVYYDWKQSLKTDLGTGYPIKYKYIELTDIFNDCKIAFSLRPRGKKEEEKKEPQQNK